MTEKAKIGVLGGSGLYEIPGLRNVRRVQVKTPFGEPSGAVTLGELEGVDCAFLPRHGQGHVLLPSEINARANIWALKSLGVERLIAVSAVGSLKEELAPRHFVVPDQLIDRTKGRTSTFFGGGIVAHVTFDRPFCAELSKLLCETAGGLGLVAHSGGTYVCMEGPQFSSKAESRLHRQLGADIVGMTAIPEAKLAREAELCYAMAALVTDYDCWKEGEEVNNEQVIQTLNANVANAIRLLASALPAACALPRRCRCARALEGAIFTSPRNMDRKAAKRLELLIGRFTRGRR
ncbi:MAG: S-methyl-5'-thioadenosine phosphorylase [Elusimicrobia bacterium]|nr:S-methyl-5'-thioadenosine phosphorylase [Elusimicrobiota bacterium]MDE2237235.1 S-methyl-5'-thioadenosine phosphorylase [Elusimicrobiota bacterium]MDE2426577.1 S-methyl-5'-thioadenosine phosphorylase [Elusimicrobiota bacterium]